MDIWLGTAQSLQFLLCSLFQGLDLAHFFFFFREKVNLQIFYFMRIHNAIKHLLYTVSSYILVGALQNAAH